jgi:hypothetical protein
VFSLTSTPSVNTAPLLRLGRDPAILDELEKEQVFFTEKPSGKPTRVYRASEIKGLAATAGQQNGTVGNMEDPERWPICESLLPAYQPRKRSFLGIFCVSSEYFYIYMLKYDYNSILFKFKSYICIKNALNGIALCLSI